MVWALDVREGTEASMNRQVLAGIAMWLIACGGDDASGQDAAVVDHDAATDGGTGTDAHTVQDANTSTDAASDARVDASTEQDASVGQDASTGTDAAVADPPKCKRGIAYGYHTVTDLTALRPGVWWWYNWSPRPESAVVSAYAGLGVEFTPMVWGGSFDGARISNELVNDARYLLGFNEPNFFVQANLSATAAAALWPQLEAIATANDLKLVSPALNFCGPAESCHDTDPFSYLDDFFAACVGCRVDYVAAHWYACDGPALTWYLEELKKYGKPIWLTEFSCGDGNDRSLAKQKQYMEDALAILEADDDVFRYAWFAGRTTAIPNVDVLGADGQLTELGQLYVSLPHHDARCAR